MCLLLILTTVIARVNSVFKRPVPESSKSSSPSFLSSSSESNFFLDTVTPIKTFGGYVNVAVKIASLHQRAIIFCVDAISTISKQWPYTSLQKFLQQYKNLVPESFPPFLSTSSSSSLPSYSIYAFSARIRIPMHGLNRIVMF